jgi:glycosyltransferase involved in cell wall biosynthesis
VGAHSAAFSASPSQDVANQKAALRARTPKRIALIIDDLTIGGAQRGLAEEACELARRGHSCHVIVLAEFPGISFRQDIEQSGTHLHHLPGAGLRDLGRFARLVRLLRRIRPDVVHTYLEYANILGVTAARLIGAPALASMRATTTQQTRWNAPKRLLQSAVLRWGADRVLVVAAAAREASERNMRLPPERIVVLPNAVDLSRLVGLTADERRAKRVELGIPLDALLVTTAARLDPIKGHRYLIPAIARLREAFPTAIFAFIGSGSEGDRTEETRLVAQAKELGAYDSIRFLPERLDVTDIVGCSDLFVLPSLAEGLSRALLEAMALGVPVVATAVGGNVDALRGGTTGWSVPSEDSTALAEAIAEALASPEKRAAMAHRASELVRSEFAVEPHVDRLESIYREMLAP